MKLSRANLSRINNDKPYALYEALFGKLLSRSKSVLLGHGFHLNNPLYTLDASTINLCLSFFPWANFRASKRAVKLHVGLNSCWLASRVCNGNRDKNHYVTVGRTLTFPKGSINVVDKGYTDYTWYKQLTGNGIFLLPAMGAKVG